jgi:hypothetical protein
MPSTIDSAAVSKGSLWAGRSISALVVVFMIFDGVTKVMKVQQVIEATVRIGFPESTIVGIGAVLLAGTALYVIPRTAVLGAILLTGYLGGATATMVRVSSPWVLFPVLIGALVWAGLYFRDEQVRALIPLRR